MFKKLLIPVFCAGLIGCASAHITPATTSIATSSKSHAAIQPQSAVLWEAGADPNADVCASALAGSNSSYCPTVSGNNLAASIPRNALGGCPDGCSNQWLSMITPYKKNSSGVEQLITLSNGTGYTFTGVYDGASDGMNDTSNAKGDLFGVLIGSGQEDAYDGPILGFRTNSNGNQVWGLAVPDICGGKSKTVWTGAYVAGHNANWKLNMEPASYYSDGVTNLYRDGTLVYTYDGPNICYDTVGNPSH